MGLIETIDSRLSNIELLLLDIRERKDQPIIKETDEVMGIKGASEFLGLAIPTIYTMVSERRIPFSKHGKKLMFVKSELMNWVKSGQRKTVADLETAADNFIRSKSVVR